MILRLLLLALLASGCAAKAQHVSNPNKFQLEPTSYVPKPWCEKPYTATQVNCWQCLELIPYTVRCAKARMAVPVSAVDSAGDTASATGAGPRTPASRIGSGMNARSLGVFGIQGGTGGTLFATRLLVAGPSAVAPDHAPAWASANALRMGLRGPALPVSGVGAHLLPPLLTLPRRLAGQSGEAVRAQPSLNAALVLDQGLPSAARVTLEPRVAAAGVGRVDHALLLSRLPLRRQFAVHATSPSADPSAAGHGSTSARSNTGSARTVRSLLCASAGCIHSSWSTSCDSAGSGNSTQGRSWQPWAHRSSPPTGLSVVAKRVMPIRPAAEDEMARAILPHSFYGSFYGTASASAKLIKGGLRIALAPPSDAAANNGLAEEGVIKGHRWTTNGVSVSVVDVPGQSAFADPDGLAGGEVFDRVGGGAVFLRHGLLFSQNGFGVAHAVGCLHKPACGAKLDAAVCEMVQTGGFDDLHEPAQGGRVLYQSPSNDLVAVPLIVSPLGLDSAQDSTLGRLRVNVPEQRATGLGVVFVVAARHLSDLALKAPHRAGYTHVGVTGRGAAVDTGKLVHLIACVLDRWRYERHEFYGCVAIITYGIVAVGTGATERALSGLAGDAGSASRECAGHGLGLHRAARGMSREGGEADGLLRQLVLIDGVDAHAVDVVDGHLAEVCRLALHRFVLHVHNYRQKPADLQEKSFPRSM